MSRIFDYYPSEWIPWKGISREEFERVRNIKREEIEKHANPDFHIRVVPDDMIEHIWLTDIYRRMKASDKEDRKTVFILPNPAPLYKRLAYLINETRINLRNVVIFAMDEWANQDGVIAPEEWPHGLFYALLEYLLGQSGPGTSNAEGTGAWDYQRKPGSLREDDRRRGRCRCLLHRSRLDRTPGLHRSGSTGVRGGF